VSHSIIITHPPGGGNRLAVQGEATSRVEWEPSHVLTPQQVYRRIDRAERKLAEIAEMLAAEPEAHVE
jgi:hypothetical protein